MAKYNLAPAVPRIPVIAGMVALMIYTSEVIGNIRESYPVGQILVAIGAVAALLLPKQVVESYWVDPKAFKTGELKAPFYVKPTATATSTQKPQTPQKP